MLETKLSILYPNETDFEDAVHDMLDDYAHLFYPFIDSANRDTLIFEPFIEGVIYNYYYDDIIAYEDSDDFIKRLGYDLAIKYGYWYKKYQYIQDLFKELDLMQSSKMTSSSSDKTSSVGGTLQKTANTPTGVSTGSDDEVNISIQDDNTETITGIDTTATTSDYVDKYTNYQGKVHSSALAKGERSSTISRQGDIETLLRVLEKLPSSFADEITKYVSKHFIQDYNI